LATPHQVQVGSLQYTVVDDCTTTYWAIITGAVSDEILGEFYTPDFTVETGRPDLQSKTTAKGLFAVTGYPDQSFPNHNSITYPPLALQLKASGFREFTLKVPMTAGALFPIVITPSPQLRRLPVRIQGRVVNGVTRAPIPNVVVSSVDNPLTPPPVHTMALRTPLYFDHLNTTAVQLVNLGAAGGANLSRDAAAGDQLLNLSTLAGLSIGALVRLSSAAGVSAEYGVVVSLSPGVPNQAFLSNQLNRSYAMATTAAQFFNPTAVGGIANLMADANAGDGVLVANQLLNGTTLVVDTGSLAEYHEIGALTDGDGYYGLDGMGRVPEVFLQASQGVLQQTIGWFIEFDNAINVVNLRLS
jgi:hypothetical protein